MSSTLEKINLPRGRRINDNGINPGWMVFDLEQRRKQLGHEFNSSLEDYPALPGNSRNDTIFNKHRLEIDKPFSSLLYCSVNSTSLINGEEGNQHKPVLVTDSCVAAKSMITDPFSVLCDRYSCADKDLIQDVLASVNGDLDEASRLLDSMLITEGNQTESFSGSDGCCLTPFKGFDESRESKAQECYESLDSFKSSSIIEPEFEFEDEDLYHLHRKDAIKLIRSASRLSKAASESYRRGDHVAARLSSIKAQEQWNAAEKLNFKAANKILSLQNSLHDIWRLDLHGLHAAEAIKALRERLQTIESALSQNGVASPVNGLASSSDPFGDLTNRLRPRLLHVITGKGNHSQGAAALPSAVKSFLNEKRYHFDEKPGVVVIRPKFRQR